MKTITKDNEIKRVSDSVAESYITKGWKYVAKSVWKDLNDSKKKR